MAMSSTGGALPCAASTRAVKWNHCADARGWDALAAPVALPWQDVEGGVSMPSGFGSLVVVVVVAALAPIVVDLIPGRLRLPQVVLLLGAGILVGPSVAGWADPDPVSLFSS